jgi:transposase
MVIRARAALVEMRTMLVNSARGLAKSYRERLPSCGTGQVRRDLATPLSEPLQKALKPLLAEVESVSQHIREYDEQIENIAKSRYPETELLKRAHGVGILTALTYVLTEEDPHRFRRNRDAGAYFGLRPRQRDSGNSRPIWQRVRNYCARRLPEPLETLLLGWRRNVFDSCGTSRTFGRKRRSRSVRASWIGGARTSIV